MAARWLADSWDQNAALYAISPIASKLEEVCERRIAELLALPKGTAAGLLSGTSMSLVCGFAVARNRLLERQGGNVAADGSFHATVFKALSLPGLGPASM